MTGSWWARLAVIVVAALLAIYALIPTFIDVSAEERLEAQAATVGGEEVDVEALETSWWAGLLPDMRIDRGLDLQGGIDLTLQVEVDEAILSTVQRDVSPFRDAARREGVAVAEVRRLRGEPALMVSLEEGGDLSVLRSFTQNHYRNYGYDGSRDVDGIRFHVLRLSEDQQAYIRERAVEQALHTLRDRIDETGVKEPSIVQKGDHRINVQLPGMDNLQQAVAAIGTTAVLEFMMVDEEAEKHRDRLEAALLLAEEQLDEDMFSDDRSLSDWLEANGHIPIGTRLLWRYDEGVDGVDQRSDFIIVRDQVILTGDDVNDAHVSMNQFNEPYVALAFKPRGGRIFAEVTGENVGKRFAIVLDDKFRSAPVIRERIGGGRASIEMGAGSYQQLMDESSILALVLRTGALPAPITIGEVRTVGATLGADAIQAGVTATLIGGGLVILLMLFFYRFVGVLANLALGLNIILIMALLAALGATLTLPGIAGIALTIGMAVDANIIIFERIREELKLGRTARAAVEGGFGSALSAVLDANVTTFIAAVVLFSYGTGPIKGFAVTLMIGIVTTLFTAIFVSRTLLDLLTRKASARLAF